MDPRIARIVELMERGLHERLSVARLAAHVHLSPSRCAQLFRQDTGVSPHQYLHELRLERARTLLERTFLSVGEVMTRVGLHDTDRFERDITRRFGTAPNELRHSGHRAAGS
jgi:transcriptional regulator GlxA family with amidase domain